MMNQFIARSQQLVATCKSVFRISATGYRLQATDLSKSEAIGYKSQSFRAASSSGMTLVETLVAITILTVAIVSPMSLTMQSLSASYYARDQIVAFNLGQEAIESMRSIRDGNILRIAYNQPNCNPMTLLCGITVNGEPFTIDTRNNAMTACALPDGSDADTQPDCPPLQTDGSLYGYQVGWNDTRYTRTVTASFVEGTQDEIRVAVRVDWVAGRLQNRTFTINENLYQWVNDGSL